MYTLRLTAHLAITFVLMLTSLSACKMKDSSSQQVRPNVLFIPVDDLRPAIRAFGDSLAITPNMDRLAEQGVIFTHAYCQQAVCNPSRASLLTGLSPDSLRVWDLRTSFRANVPDVVTLPQYFKENGYHTVGIGKIFHNTIPDTLSWTEKPHIDGYPFDPDAVYVNDENKRRVEEKKQEYIKRGINRVDQLGHWYIKTVATEMSDVPDNAYFDGAQTDLAIEKLQDLNQGDRPFFLAVGYYRPHLPFNAPRKYWDLYDRDKIPLATNQQLPQTGATMAMNLGYELRGYEDFRDLPKPGEGSLSADRQKLLIHGYYASVSYIDAQIGRLLDELERLGLKENTIVVLWGDHGWKLGDHNAWCKQTNYEVDTRVPLIFAGPGVKAKGKPAHAPTEFLDIYPTLCEMADLHVPDHLHGNSLVPLLNNPQMEWNEVAFSQFLRGRFSRSKIDFQGQEYMGYAMRTERYRYIEWYEWDAEMESKRQMIDVELFDHQTDPIESINFAKDLANKDIIDSLSMMMKKYWR